MAAGGSIPHHFKQCKNRDRQYAATKNWIVKKFHLIALLAVLGGGMLRAQTNATAAPKPPRAPTLINSDYADFDLLSTPRKAFYYGNVQVDDPQMKLTCEKMVADLPPTGGHVSRIVAETNVLIAAVDDKGQTNHSTSDKAVYDYNVQGIVTNETITLSGHASATNADGSWIRAEPLVWDRATGHIYGTNEVMSIKPATSNLMKSTNSPATKTNATIEDMQKVNPIAPRHF
jgi:lipopolysaccharide export system protein LptA